MQEPSAQTLDEASLAGVNARLDALQDAAIRRLHDQVMPRLAGFCSAVLLCIVADLAYGLPGLQGQSDWS